MSDLGMGSIVSKNTVSVNSIVKAIRIDHKDNVIQSRMCKCSPPMSNHSSIIHKCLVPMGSELVNI